MHKLLTLTAGLTLAAGVLIPTGLAYGHSTSDQFGQATCTEQGDWTAPYNLTATNPELNPQATISNPASPFTVTVPATGYTYTFHVPGNQDSLQVQTTVKWSDGFTKALAPLTIERPGTCPPPTTTTSPPATTVAPPVTTVPPEATTITQPVVTTLAPPTTITNQPLPTNPAAASQKIGALPTTGTATTALIGIGAAILIAGILLLAAASDRRKNQADQ